jgi:hypothetical protein
MAIVPPPLVVRHQYPDVAPPLYDRHFEPNPETHCKDAEHARFNKQDIMLTAVMRHNI